MKIRNRTIGSFSAAVALCFLAGAACSQQSTPAAAPASSANSSNTSLTPTGPLTRLTHRSGSKMRIQGHALTGDWQSESGVITGFLEVGPNFPLEPGQSVTPGKVEARGEASVGVRSLKSKKKDNSYYSDAMDDKMYNMLMETNHPKIVFRLTELVLKEAPQDKTAPYVFDAKGDLAIAGVTNAISFPAKITPQGEKDGDRRVKINGELVLKMSQFKISPAQILFVKTEDDVAVKFDWVVGEKKAATGAK
jgi:hypothetical protein